MTSCSACNTFHDLYFMHWPGLRCFRNWVPPPFGKSSARLMGFSCRYRQSGEPGILGPIQAFKEDLLASASGLAQQQRTRLSGLRGTHRNPSQSHQWFWGPKLSLDLGECRDRAEDQLGMPGKVGVKEVQFTNIWCSSAWLPSSP